MAKDLITAKKAALRCHKMLPSFIRNPKKDTDPHKLEIWFKSNPVYFQINALF